MREGGRTEFDEALHPHHVAIKRRLIQDLGFRVPGFGFRGLSFGFRVSNFGFLVSGFGVKV